MNIEKRGMTIALGLAVLATLSLGQMSALAILAISVGALLLVVGLWISYRPASVFGFMTLAIGSGIAVNFSSLTEFSTLMSAFLGILVPVYIAGWVALSSEIEGPIEISVRNRSTLITIVYTVICGFSVPIALSLIGLMAPNMSTHVSMITEAAIMLLVIAIAVILLTGRTPRARTQERSREEAASELA
ncbi:MAG: hypothetical protein A3K76_05670 [Euryarchaeota archaeon RBG_13_57_23]|nr:MAG: hypothetical protein A3K76_05670 [Euryarchaeota archaeon RBG_13_57_23]